MAQRAHGEGKGVATAQSPPSNRVLQRSGIRSIGDSPTSEMVEEVLSRPGRPMDLSTRLAMEPRFGRDFSQVRVHSDALAAESARAVGAQAYTVLRGMVFDTGQYAPGSPDGQRLLAHELTHVAQQDGLAPAGSLIVGAADHHAEHEADSVASSMSGNAIIPSPVREAAPVIRRQPLPASTSAPPSAPSPYKPLADKIADAQRSGRFGVGSLRLPVLRKLEELADAVELKDLAAVRATTTEFIALDTAHPLDPATAVMLSDVPMVLVSRILLLGLTAESQRLERHFFLTRRSAYEQPTRGEGFSTRYAVLHRVVDEVVAGATFDGLVTAERTIDLALVAFTEINNAAAQLDLAEVRKEQDAVRAEAAAGGYYDPIEGLSGDRARTPGKFYSGLMGLVPPLVEVMQRAFQVLMDAAIGELEVGTGHAALAKAKTVLTTKMAPVLEAFEVALKDRKAQQPAVLDPSFGLRRPLTVSIDVTRSNFDKEPRRHLDYFDRGKRAASVEIEAYEQGETFFTEKSLDARRTFEIRAAQIATLERLFGLATDNAGRVTADSKQNVGAVRAASGFRLHDNDSWRRFLLEKFRAARTETKDDWKALNATVAVLQSYLSSFTLHTPYNIDEFGENYLTRTFPRTLTGQLIHDCGVYALRVAYALSLVRQELGLTFRAAVMPAHVGLVITFGDDISKGALYLNNNEVVVVSGARLEEFADVWRATDAMGKPLSQPANLKVGKLHAEIAAATFAERVDVPVRLVDVPATPSVRRPAVNKRALWDFYHQQVITPSSIAPAKDTPQPELQYLNFLRAMKDVHNTLRVPLYRQVHELFVKHRQELTVAAADIRSPDPTKRARAQAVLTNHKHQLVVLFAPLRNQLAELDQKATEVNDFMRSHPEAIGSGAQLRPAARLGLTADFAIDDYLGDATHPGLLLSGQITPGGWADDDALPRPED